MKEKTGKRGMKYQSVIEALDDDELYTPGSIAELAVKKGLLPGRQAPELERRRLRITLGRWSRGHGWPRQGDDILFFKGQPPAAAWFGRRWKESYLGQADLP